MDVFGLGSLVDKIGERFGSRAQDALLLLVLVTAFVLGAHAIITYGVIPVVEFVRGVSSRSALGLLPTVAYGALIGGTAAIVFTLVVRWLVKRTIVPLVRRADAHVKRAEQIVDSAQAFSDDISARLDRAISLEEAARGISNGDQPEPKGKLASRPKKPAHDKIDDGKHHQEQEQDEA